MLILSFFRRRATNLGSGNTAQQTGDQLAQVTRTSVSAYWQGITFYGEPAKLIIATTTTPHLYKVCIQRDRETRSCGWAMDILTSYKTLLAIECLVELRQSVTERSVIQCQIALTNSQDCNNNRHVDDAISWIIGLVGREKFERIRNLTVNNMPRQIMELAGTRV